ncbi:snakin-2-like [Benincasa hispida]|uniref:snakin-2-like n=1 Tax=Benincasa hispida TaxID=102211 RepID=UPI0018FF1E4C|nr:snakin-2-like [Benincasa hispida]
MAVRNFLLLLLLGLFVILSLSQVSSDGYPEEGMMEMEYDEKVMRGTNRRLMQNINCGWECKRRCGAHSRPNRCIRACGTCCSRCKCVPSGTSGNREMCGTCYTNMTTHGNKTKCP